MFPYKERFYTGIGSRQTPPDVLDLMTELAGILAYNEFILRSGHATGADRAFEIGCDGLSRIYLPWEDFGVKPYLDDPGMEVIGTEIAFEDQYERNFKRMVTDGLCRNTTKQAMRKLHGRNYCQVYGHDAESTPSEFLVCWTKNARLIGGTATAIKLTNITDIPVYNLADPSHRKKIEKCCEHNSIDTLII